MAYVKNKKTRVSIGATVPATKDLATAETAADTSFMCLIDTMNGLDLTRATLTEPSVYCAAATSFLQKDTDELDISNLTIEGFVDDDPANGYDAVNALADAMIKADTRGTIVITEPDGTSKMWLEIKLVRFGKIRGGAQDRQKFAMEMIAMTMPADA